MWPFRKKPEFKEAQYIAGLLQEIRGKDAHIAMLRQQLTCKQIQGGSFLGGFNGFSSSQDDVSEKELKRLKIVNSKLIKRINYNEAKGGK